MNDATGDNTITQWREINDATEDNTITQWREINDYRQKTIQ